MRIASLQPSISITLEQLGCLDLLVACTKYCVDAVPALKKMPVQVIHDSWSAKTEEILGSRADLVLASVPYRMEPLAAILKAGRTVLTFAPKCLADVCADIVLLGRVAGRVAAAQAIVAEMRSQVEAVQVRADGARRLMVYCEEWGKPLIHSQLWVAEMVGAAGGRCIGIPGAVTEAEAVMAANPDVLIFAWCGAGERVPLEKIVLQRGWEQMRAVRERRVYCIADEWLNTPASTLMKGLEALAAAIHPEIFIEMKEPRRLAQTPARTNPSKLTE